MRPSQGRDRSDWFSAVGGVSVCALPNQNSRREAWKRSALIVGPLRYREGGSRSGGGAAHARDCCIRRQTTRHLKGSAVRENEPRSCLVSVKGRQPHDDVSTRRFHEDVARGPVLRRKGPEGDGPVRGGGRTGVLRSGCGASTRLAPTRAPQQPKSAASNDAEQCDSFHVTPVRARWPGAIAPG
jgi:hypothetical protein